MRHFSVIGATCLELLLLPIAFADTIDSGYVENNGNSTAVIFSTVVEIPDAVRMRLYFDEVLLSGDPEQGTESYLVMTSLYDDATQTMNATDLSQWQNSSAYFNGDAVKVEMISHPQTGLNRVVLADPVTQQEEAESSVSFAF